MFALNNYFERKLVGILEFLDWDTEVRFDQKLKVGHMVDRKVPNHTFRMLVEQVDVLASIIIFLIRHLRLTLF